MLTEERRAEFHQQVADHKLKADGSRSDRPVRIIGILLMIGGLAGAFVSYNASLAQSDTRDITSSLILAVACLGLVVVGAAMYVATAITKVLRLWLLRQLVEGQAHTDQIAAALRERGVNGEHPLDRLDATGLVAAVGAGELTPRELIEESIARIEARNPALNAIAHARFEEALAEVDAGLPDGPLRGIPVLVKDLYADVAGLPSTRGSRLWAECRPTADSELVRRYKGAGAVVLGTTNVPELGYNASTEGQLFGPCRNPRDPSRSTGGSSGGSAAAVAAAMVPVATASDGGGSIRIPASMNGLFGLKPSRGRVSPAPYPTLLSGPVSVHHALTTTVRDSALLLDVAHGSLPGDAFGAPTPAASFRELAGRDPGRLRIGLATAPGDGAEASQQVLTVLREAAELLAGLGHEVVEMTLDYTLAEAQGGGAVLMGAGLVAGVDARLAELGRELRDDDLEPFTRMLYEHYRGTLTGADVARALETAQQVGWRLGRQLDRQAGGVDVVVTPTLAEPVPPLGLLDTTRPESIWEHAGRYSSFTSVFNLTGQPAMSLPLGTDAQGLPVGVQVAADLGQEGLLLALATQVERAAPWARHAPRA